jgi:hypothetical protein
MIFPGAAAWLLYDNTANRWVISSVSSLPDYGKKQEYWFSGGSTTIGDWGHMAFGAISSGTLLSESASDNVFPSSLGLRTSATAASGYYLGFPKTQTSNSTFGDSHSSVEAYVSLSGLSVTADTFYAHIRFAQTSNTNANTLANANTISILYSHVINGGNWSLISVDNSGTVSTAVDLGVAAAIDVPILLRLEIDKGLSEARAYVNGAYAGRVTTNLPDTSAILGTQAIIQKMLTGNGVDALRIHNMKGVSIYD